MKFYGISVLEMFHFKGKISSPNFIILKLFVIYQTALLMIKIFISSSILSSIECFITLYLLSFPFLERIFGKKNQENFANEFFLRCECQQNGGITCRSLVSVTIEHVLI